MNFLIYMLVAAQWSLIAHGLQDWQSFKHKYGKSYETENIDRMRQSIFAKNKQQVDDFNANQSASIGFSVSLNHMSDLTEAEIKAKSGLKLMAKNLRKNTPKSERFLAQILNDDTPLPDSINWRYVPGRVSRAKDQLRCAASYAFAATGALEGQEYRKYENSSSIERGGLVELSEQNLVDCVPKTNGCDGGDPVYAIDYVHEEGGIEAESTYPYEGRDRRCRFKKSKSVFNADGVTFLPSGDEEALKRVVARFGPVATAIDASGKWFPYYHRGVYYDENCKKGYNSLDRATLIIGYGTHPSWGEYWLAKECLGIGFGTLGTMMLARNRNNSCGVSTAASIPRFDSD